MTQTLVIHIFALKTTGYIFIFIYFGSQAFEVLGTVEIAIKELKNHPLPLPELARKHEEFSRSIKDTSAEPLQRGQLIIQKLDPQRWEDKEQMLQCVKNRAYITADIQTPGFQGIDKRIGMFCAVSGVHRACVCVCLFVC